MGDTTNILSGKFKDVLDQTFTTLQSAIQAAINSTPGMKGVTEGHHLIPTRVANDSDIAPLMG